jgi:hypothetical protein
MPGPTRSWGCMAYRKPYLSRPPKPAKIHAALVPMLPGRRPRADGEEPCEAADLRGQGNPEGEDLTPIFRSMLLLLFVGGLAAFFLIYAGRWLPSQVAEPLVVRVSATPDLQSWLEEARRRFLANSSRVAGRPLSLIIDYEEDAVASRGIVERLRRNALPSSTPSAPSADAVWLTSRTAVQLLETRHRMHLSDKAVSPLASTMLAVIMWEGRARDVLPAAVAVPSRSQPLSWNDVDISWVAWHKLSIRPAQGHLS